MNPRIIGQRVKGASHSIAGTVCQDFFKWNTVNCDSNSYILAIADGHGSKSCPYSDEGSEIACTVFLKVINTLYENFNGQETRLFKFLSDDGRISILQSIEKEWKNAVISRNETYPERKIDQNSINTNLYEKYGSTLLGVLLTESFLFVYQIGDGDILYVDADGVTGLVETEKIPGVEVNSLCAKESWKYASTSIRVLNNGLKSPSAIFLTTDGFSNSYANDDIFIQTINDYFESLNKSGADIIEQNLEKWLTETSNDGAGDDITMLILYNNEQNAFSSVDNSNDQIQDCCEKGSNSIDLVEDDNLSLRLSDSEISDNSIIVENEDSNPQNSDTDNTISD